MKELINLFKIFIFITPFLAGCTFFDKLTEKPNENSNQYIVTASNLNIRKMPNEHSPILFKIPKDSTVNLIEKTDSTWLKIEYKSKVGFGSGEYLSPNIQTSNWEVFWWVMAISFVASLITVGGIKTQIPDARYSDGSRDGESAFGCGSILFISLLLAVISSVLWIVYVV